MKKAALLLILILMLMVPATVNAWDDCPRGKVCTYPGKCSRYVDTNGDGICDHGQEEPVVIASAKSTDFTEENSNIQSSDTTGAIQTENTASLNLTTTDSDGKTIQNIFPSQSKVNNRQIYHLTQITIILTLLYAISHIMSKKRIIRVVTHRKIWNIALLASFLASLILGVILIINVNFGTHISLPFDMLLWHVEAGIAMGVISVFHIIWHWNYFKKMVKSLTTT